MAAQAYALLKKRQQEQKQQEQKQQELKQQELKQEEQKQQELKQEEQKQEEQKQQEQKQEEQKASFEVMLPKKIFGTSKTNTETELGEFDDNFSGPHGISCSREKNKSNIHR